MLLLRLVIRPFLLLFFFWVSWFIYCVNVFIWALRMTFLAHVRLLDTKRMYSVELSEDSLSLSLSENAFNYGSHGTTHNCSMPKKTVQLSSPVIPNKRWTYNHKLLFAFCFPIFTCWLYIVSFYKVFIENMFYYQLCSNYNTSLTFKYLFYQEIWIINHWKNCFIFNTLILWIHFKNHKKYNYTVCRKIFAIVLFSPLLPLLLANNFKTGLIPMYRIISYFSLK